MTGQMLHASTYIKCLGIGKTMETDGIEVAKGWGKRGVEGYCWASVQNDEEVMEVDSGNGWMTLLVYLMLLN
jgi:hypothetical protein